MLTATTTSSATSSSGSGTDATSSAFRCTKSYCEGTSLTRKSELFLLQALCNKLAKLSKMVFKPLAIDGQIGANTTALLQSLAANYKFKTSSPITWEVIAGSPQQFIVALKTTIDLAGAVPLDPYKDSGTSIPGVPPKKAEPVPEIPQPGAGAQVTPQPDAPAPTPGPTPTPSGWASWSFPQKAVVLSGGLVVLAGIAMTLRRKKPAAAIAGLFGLKRRR